MPGWATNIGIKPEGTQWECGHRGHMGDVLHMDTGGGAVSLNRRGEGMIGTTKPSNILAGIRYGYPLCCVLYFGLLEVLGIHAQDKWNDSVHGWPWVPDNLSWGPPYCQCISLHCPIHWALCKREGA